MGKELVLNPKVCFFVYDYYKIGEIDTKHNF